MFSRFSLLAVVLVSAIAATLPDVAVVADECANGVPLPADFNGAEWPALYRLTSPDPEEPTEPNFDESTTVDPSVLANAGITYQFIDPSGFDYPNATAQIPWSPSEGGNSNNDPLVQQIRDENDYQYADIIVVTDFIPKFWDEHLHEATTIRYMLDGSGYFDLRDTDDNWVRIPVSAGDWFEWPSGIDHRFTVDEESYIQAMRLYKGSASPEWTAVPRSQTVAGNNTARNEYVDTYLCGIDPDTVLLLDVEGPEDDSEDISEDVSEDDGNSTAVAQMEDDDEDGQCTANSQCAALNLAGACCPAANGVILECCDTYVNPNELAASTGVVVRSSSSAFIMIGFVLGSAATLLTTTF